jgi:hypothetical protein
MKFGKTLAEQTLKEWRFYYVDYKELKKTLNKANDESLSDEEARSMFDAILDTSESKLSKFYHDKLGWATSYITTLEKRVEDLRASASEPRSPASPASPSSMSSNGSVFSDESDGITNSSPTGIADDIKFHFDKLSMHEIERGSDGAYLKEAYRRMGTSKHFQAYIYAKKSLVTFQREGGKFFAMVSGCLNSNWNYDSEATFLPIFPFVTTN